MKLPALALLFLVLLAGAMRAHGQNPAEPDWRKRFDYWTSREQNRFPPPRTNTPYVVTRADGAVISGILLDCTESNVILRGEFGDTSFDRTDLSREDRIVFFRDDFARANALERVLVDKRELLARSLPAPVLAAQAQRMTAVQFSDFADQQDGIPVFWPGRIEDVRLDYFGDSEAVMTVAGLNADAPRIEVLFPIPGDVSLQLRRGQEIRVFGRIKSLRMREGRLRLSLRDASLD